MNVFFLFFLIKLNGIHKSIFGYFALHFNGLNNKMHLVLPVLVLYLVPLKIEAIRYAGQKLNEN